MLYLELIHILYTHSLCELCVYTTILCLGYLHSLSGPMEWKSGSTSRALSELQISSTCSKLLLLNIHQVFINMDLFLFNLFLFITMLIFCGEPWEPIIVPRNPLNQTAFQPYFHIVISADFFNHGTWQPWHSDSRPCDLPVTPRYENDSGGFRKVTVPQVCPKTMTILV